MGFSVGPSINLLIVRLERRKLKIYLGRFPFVTTDRPDHSRRNNNFPLLKTLQPDQSNSK